LVFCGSGGEGVGRAVWGRKAFTAEDAENSAAIAEKPWAMAPRGVCDRIRAFLPENCRLTATTLQAMDSPSIPNLCVYFYFRLLL
jgi:hypothetical protein